MHNMLLALLPVAAVAAHSPPQQFQGTEVVVVAARGAHVLPEGIFEAPRHLALLMSVLGSTSTATVSRPAPRSGSRAP